MNRLPIAYPAWARVGIRATSSFDAPKSSAILDLVRSDLPLQHRGIRYKHGLDVSFKGNFWDLLENSRGLKWIRSIFSVT